MLAGRELVDDRGEHGREPVGVGLHPAGPVDDQDRRGAVGGDQPGEVADQPGRPVRAVAQLGDRRGGLGAGDLRAVAGDPGAQRHGEAPVDHPGSGLRSHGATVPGGPTLTAVAGGERAGGGVERVPRAQGVEQVDLVGEQREHHRPAVGVGDGAGQAAHAGEGAGLGAHEPEARFRVVLEPLGERAGEAGDRQPGQDRAEVGLLRRTGDLEQGGRGCPGRAGCRGRARCRRTPRRPWSVRRAPSASRRCPRRRPRTTPAGRSPGPTCRASTSAASLSLVSRVCSTSWLSGWLVTLASSVAPSRRGRGSGDADDLDAGLGERGGEHRGGRRRRVVDPAEPAGGAALVDPERLDRRHDAVRDVAGRPVRADVRTGEQGGVVADAGPSRPVAVRRPSRPGEPRSGPARDEQRVAAADQHDPAAVRRATTVVANVWSGPSVSSAAAAVSSLRVEAGMAAPAPREYSGAPSSPATVASTCGPRSSSSSSGASARRTFPGLSGPGVAVAATGAGVVTGGSSSPSGGATAAGLSAGSSTGSGRSTTTYAVNAATRTPSTSTTGSQKATREPWRTSRRPTVHPFRLRVCGHCARDWTAPAPRAR